MVSRNIRSVAREENFVFCFNHEGQRWIYFAFSARSTNTVVGLAIKGYSLTNQNSPNSCHLRVEYNLSEKCVGHTLDLKRIKNHYYL